MKKERKDYKNLLLVVLMIISLTMAVGYAAIAQRLEVSGTTTIANAKWDVKIISIEETNKKISNTEVAPSTGVGETTGTTSSTIATGATSATFNVQLNAPGDFAEFTVTVKNLGTIDAVLNSLQLTQDTTPTEITYTVTPADETSATTLSTNGTETYVVRVQWTADSGVPETGSKNATLVLNYIQAS